MKVIIAAAGTGGHINPGLAIANKIKEEEKEDKLQEIIDDIRNKFGDSVIGFANEKNNK